MGRGIQSSWGHQLRTVIRGFAFGSQVPAQRRQERCGQLIKGVRTRPVPGSSPALRQTPRAASSTSPAASSSEGETQRGQRGSYLCSPPGHTGQWPPWASQPRRGPARTTAGAGREQGQPVWDLRESPGRRWCAHIATCPISHPAAGHPPCLRAPPQLSPRPAPRRLPWTAAGPSGWASSPQTPPRSTPGPHCAGSSPHLSPCREETRCKGLLFHIMLQQRPPRSTSCPQPPFVPPHPRGCSPQCSCPVWGGSSQARRHPRLVAGVDMEPVAVLAPTSTSGFRGERPSRHPLREVTRKSWGFRCRSLALPQAQQLPENLHQPQCTHTQPGLMDTAKGLQPHPCPITPSTPQKEQVPQ